MVLGPPLFNLSIVSSANNVDFHIYGGGICGIYICIYGDNTQLCFSFSSDNVKQADNLFFCINLIQIWMSMNVLQREN